MKKILKIILPLALGLLMVFSLTRKVDWDVVLKELDGVSWMWVLISLVLALLSHVFRGIRWRMQLRNLGINPSVHAMSVSIFGNYGLNLVFPRMGEIWRCSYISHNYGIPFSTTVGTMVSERIVDMLVAGLMTVAAFVHERGHFSEFLSQSDGGQKILDLLFSPVLWLSIVGCGVLVLFAALFFRHTALFLNVKRFLLNMWNGIKDLKNVPHLWGYLAWSAAIWGCYYLNSYTCCFFFGFTEHLDAWAGLAIFVMGSLSLVLPVQGGLGPWHYAVATALLCYGIGREITDPRIQAFVWVAWSIEQGFVLLLGLYAMLAMNSGHKKG